MAAAQDTMCAFFSINVMKKRGGPLRPLRFSSKPRQRLTARRFGQRIMFQEAGPFDSNKFNRPGRRRLVAAVSGERRSWLRPYA